jgi:hypothetical protein
MNRGYIKIWRKLEDSGLLQLPTTLALFMHILLKATHKDRKVGTPNGVITLKRGQFMSGRIELASTLKQTEQQIRTSLKRLQDLEIITIEATNRYSVYTIENYRKYQDMQVDNNQPDNQQTTNKQPTDNQQITTKQELNNLNTEELNKTSMAANACPYDDLLNAYHESLPNNPKCKVLNNSRKSAMKQRWNEAAKLDCLPFGYKTKEQGIEAWKSFFRVCSQSDFLVGKVAPLPGKAVFYADIDFLFSPSGFAKILENKYHREAA